MSKRIKFVPISFSWAAINPHPKGVIYFIGGAFFGSFPNIFYRYLLKSLFNNGYTIVALPYRFTFRHWSVSVSLMKDLEAIKRSLVYEAKSKKYSYTIYENTDFSDTSNFFWLGHSLGCKYIALLELLTDLHQNGQNVVSKKFGACIPKKEQENLISSLRLINHKKVSIKDETSILMAPAIEGIEGAIPIFRNNRFPKLRKILNLIGIKVEPSQEETFCLINQSQLFNLTSLIFFDTDTRVAAPTVHWLLKNLKNRLMEKQELQGKHLAPIGWQQGDSQIPETVLKFIYQKKK